MFIRSAVWWLKTMWKTISCKQSSEIIWLVEEWYCQAPLLDIIEPLKWRSAAGYVVACSSSPRCELLSWGPNRSNQMSTYCTYHLEKPKNQKKAWPLFVTVFVFLHAMFPDKQLKCARTRTREGLLNLCSRFSRLVTKERRFIRRSQNVNECCEKKKSLKCYRHLHSWEAQNVRGTSLYSVGI